MALVTCSECGSDVSDLAKSCPKCGAPVAIAPKERGHGCLVAIAVIVGIFILLWIFSSGTTPSDTQTSSESLASASSSATGNPVHDRLLTLSMTERNAALANLMQSSGERCRSVTRSMYQGQDADHNAYWSLACANRREYQVMIHADASGSTVYLDCAAVKVLIGRNECWKAF